jgi:hypothetical protein
MTTMTATRKTSAPRDTPGTAVLPLQDRAPSPPPWGRGDPTDDPIHHALSEVMRRAPATPVDVLRDVDRVVRSHWARYSVYFSAGRDDLKLRDEAIIRDYQKGERTGLLARRYKLTAQRIRQILAEHRATRSSAD